MSYIISINLEFLLYIVEKGLKLIKGDRIHFGGLGSKAGCVIAYSSQCFL
jgi:hypothetical protein